MWYVSGSRSERTIRCRLDFPSRGNTRHVNRSSGLSVFTNVIESLGRGKGDIDGSKRVTVRQKVTSSMVLLYGKKLYFYWND